MGQVNIKWLPIVDLNRCNGCNACVEACGPKSLSIIHGKAVLVNLETCGSEEHCIAPCPVNAIWMEWLPHTGNMDRGKWSTDQRKGNE